MSPTTFMIMLVAAIVILTVLTLKFKMHPVMTLFITAVFIRLVSGKPLVDTFKMCIRDRAGAIDYLSTWLGNNLSPLVAKTIVGLIAGAMSFFSSTLGVVAPTLIPVIPGISEATGVGATTLISAIMVGGHFAGVSPFSTGGAMVMTGENDENKRGRLFIYLMALSLCSIAFASLLTVLGVFA